MDTMQFQLITLSDLAGVQAAGYAKRYSTVAEYQEAQNAVVTNRASEQIDKGNEPYLLSRDAMNLGVHPFITVYDVARERRGRLVGISTAKNTYWLEPDTLLAWR